ncbi:MAG: hypothetical protein ACK4UN_00810 [Limisphaerales bacterium]
MPDSHLVLIFEPNTREAPRLEEAFKQQKMSNPARVLRHVSELQSYVSGAGIYGNRDIYPTPGLLLLDFTEPVFSLNILEWLGRRGFLNQFPVIGMGSALNDNMLQLAFDLGLAGFYEKQGEFGSVAKMIAGLQWVDGWNPKFGEGEAPHLLTKEQFYRSGAA